MWLIRRGVGLFAWDIERDGDEGVDEVFHPLSAKEVEHHTVYWAPKHRNVAARPLGYPMHLNVPDGQKHEVEYAVTREQYYRSR